MTDTFRGATFERDALAAAMTQLPRHSLKHVAWEAFTRQRPPARGGAIGTWSVTSGDPLAEILVVRDEDFSDTLAWLNSFFSGLSPITQWCRVVTHSEAARIANRPLAVGLGRMLGAWVGGVLAECSAQYGGAQSLRDVPGSAAVSTATFAAGRATAIWNDDSKFTEIARRHDELSHSLRDGSRPLTAGSLVPVWSVLADNSTTSAYGDRRALKPVVDILCSLVHQVDDLESADLVARTAMQARDFFDLPELTECAQGPQVERVRALDRLGERLAKGPRSPAIDALVGLGASFIDPGSAVAPELLRRHAKQVPIAPIWQGVFAGAMMPFRTMTDQGGLGRIVAKELLALDDLQGRPSSDIAYEELIRWIKPGRVQKLDLRAMSARTLSVEIMTGVTCMFSYSRTDVASTSSTRVEPARSHIDRSRGGGRTLQDLDNIVMNLQSRIDNLEKQITNPQHNLDIIGAKEGRSRKKIR